MREQSVDLPLRGIRLPEVTGGADVDLGVLPGVTVLTLIRHRF